MKQLWITLPALAPDYSGVCSALFDLGGMSIIHDASGCTGNYTGYDEPRWYGAHSMVFCSGLREIDAVLGRDDKLIGNVLKASEYTDPTLYALIGSPVPMVIGSDMKGIAREIENETGRPAFGFSTNGIGLYNKGVSEAMLAVMKRFRKTSGKKVPRSINVLGTTPLDFSANSNAEDLYQALEKAGWTIIGKMMMGADLGQIERLSEAEVNLVVTESGFPAAEYLYVQDGIPYVAGTLTGSDKELLELLEKTREDGVNRVLGQEKTVKNFGKKVLFVGEQILGNSIRNSVYRRDPEIPVVVATMTGLRKELAQEGDLDLDSEEKVIAALDSGEYALLVGDPLLGDVAPEEVPLIGIPHVALSSKLYWNRSVHFIGTEMDDIVKKIIGVFCESNI